MNRTEKVNVMRIVALVLYLSSFFMALYKMTILGDTYRFYIQSIGAGGFFSFVMYFLIAYNIFLLATKRDYSKEVFVVVTAMAIIMFIGVAASIPAGASVGGSLIFQVIFVFYMIFMAANEDIPVQNYDAIRNLIRDMFPETIRSDSAIQRSREERYEEEHDKLHDMDFEKLKNQHKKKDFYNDRALQPKRTLEEIQESRYKNEKKVEETVVPEPIMEAPVVETPIEVEPVIEPEEVKSGYTVKAPQMKAPQMTNPFMKKPTYKK